MEARCSLPNSGAINNWPAFWATGIATGAPGTWPATGEIDVVEGLSAGAYGHWHGPTPGTPSQDDSFGVTPTAPNSFTGWHVYGAERTSSTITWYYDGIAIGSRNARAQTTATPMFLLLTYQANATGPVATGAWER